MQSVHAIATTIVAREGGFVNDPDDPGGATKYGVTIGTMRRLGLDVTRDGIVNQSDVKALSQDQAVEIFKAHYFDAPGIGQLPPEIQSSVFDMQVNAGSNAVKILQRLLKQFGQNVHVDGVIGPHTAHSAKQTMSMAPHHMADAYGIARRNYYYALADMRPSSRKYARRRDGSKGGWIIRAEEFISSKYHLKDAEHRERTESWD